METALLNVKIELQNSREVGTLRGEKCETQRPTVFWRLLSALEGHLAQIDFINKHWKSGPLKLERNGSNIFAFENDGVEVH